MKKPVQTREILVTKEQAKKFSELVKRDKKTKIRAK